MIDNWPVTLAATASVTWISPFPVSPSGRRGGIAPGPGTAWSILRAPPIRCVPLLPR